MFDSVSLELKFIQREVVDRFFYIHKYQRIKEKKIVRTYKIINKKRIQKKSIRLHASTLLVKKQKRNEYLTYKESARKIVHTYLDFYINKFKEHDIFIKPVGRISIKHTVSRWGSCSSKGNVNFSYRLATIPLHLAEYIVVHELCHLREFNHSDRFWNLVELVVPDYKNRKKELTEISLRKIT